GSQKRSYLPNSFRLADMAHDEPCDDGMKSKSERTPSDTEGVREWRFCILRRHHGVARRPSTRRLLSMSLPISGAYLIPGMAITVLSARKVMSSTCMSTSGSEARFEMSFTRIIGPSKKEA